jgi:hypothetical protein
MIAGAGETNAKRAVRYGYEVHEPQHRQGTLSPDRRRDAIEGAIWVQSCTAEMIMRYQDVVDESKQWPLDQQLLLLEEMTHTLRTELASKSEPQPHSAPAVWRGMLKTAAPAPADQDLADAYTQYVMDKHL